MSGLIKYGQYISIERHVNLLTATTNRYCMYVLLSLWYKDGNSHQLKKTFLKSQSINTWKLWRVPPEAGRAIRYWSSPPEADVGHPLLSLTHPPTHQMSLRDMMHRMGVCNFFYPRDVPTEYDAGLGVPLSVTHKMFYGIRCEARWSVVCCLSPSLHEHFIPYKS